jgi:hypothetical protein
MYRPRKVRGHSEELSNDRVGTAATPGMNGGRHRVHHVAPCGNQLGKVGWVVDTSADEARTSLATRMQATGPPTKRQPHMRPLWLHTM